VDRVDTAILQRDDDQLLRLRALGEDRRLGRIGRLVLLVGDAGDEGDAHLAIGLRHGIGARLVDFSARRLRIVVADMTVVRLRLGRRRCQAPDGHRCQKNQRPHFPSPSSPERLLVPRSAPACGRAGALARVARALARPRWSAILRARPGLPESPAPGDNRGRKTMSRPFALVASETAEARAAKARLEARYPTVAIDEAEVIVALGGDGLMLETLHRFIDRAV